ncbi:MAG: hypothetical protein RIQ41_159 [Candidatus Parcubacteria bacterium]|jgi:hypothetical protein
MNPPLPKEPEKPGDTLPQEAFSSHASTPESSEEYPSKTKEKLTTKRCYNILRRILREYPDTTEAGIAEKLIDELTAPSAVGSEIAKKDVEELIRTTLNQLEVPGDDVTDEDIQLVEDAKERVLILLGMETEVVAHTPAAGIVSANSSVATPEQMGLGREPNNRPPMLSRLITLQEKSTENKDVSVVYRVASINELKGVVVLEHTRSDGSKKMTTLPLSEVETLIAQKDFETEAKNIRNLLTSRYDKLIQRKSALGTTVDLSPFSQSDDAIQQTFLSLKEASTIEEVRNIAQYLDRRLASYRVELIKLERNKEPVSIPTPRTVLRPNLTQEGYFKETSHIKPPVYRNLPKVGPLKEGQKITLQSMGDHDVAKWEIKNIDNGLTAIERVDNPSITTKINTKKLKEILRTNLYYKNAYQDSQRAHPTPTTVTAASEPLPKPRSTPPTINTYERKKKSERNVPLRTLEDILRTLKDDSTTSFSASYAREYRMLQKWANEWIGTDENAVSKIDTFREENHRPDIHVSEQQVKLEKLTIECCLEMLRLASLAAQMYENGERENPSLFSSDAMKNITSNITSSATVLSGMSVEKNGLDWYIKNFNDEAGHHVDQLLGYIDEAEQALRADELHDEEPEIESVEDAEAVEGVDQEQVDASRESAVQSILSKLPQNWRDNAWKYALVGALVGSALATSAYELFKAKKKEAEPTTDVVRQIDQRQSPALEKAIYQLHAPGYERYKDSFMKDIVALTPEGIIKTYAPSCFEGVSNFSPDSTKMKLVGGIFCEPLLKDGSVYTELSTRERKELSALITVLDSVSVAVRGEHSQAKTLLERVQEVRDATMSHNKKQA